MPLDAQHIADAVNTDVANMVGTRVRDAAGTDPLKQDWWWYNFGIAYFDYGADPLTAAEVADKVLVDQPLPPLDDGTP